MYLPPIEYSIQKIKEEFNKSGFNYKMVKRAGDVAIFKQSLINGSYSCYEVIAIKLSEPHPVWNKDCEYDLIECYPSNSEWGKNGFTCMDIGAAEKRLEEILSKIELKRLSIYEGYQIT